MPKGISSQQTQEDFNSTVVTEGEELYTIRPLWELTPRSRMRVAQAFVDRRVEVEVWPNRTEGDPANYTARKCRVLSAAFNQKWGLQNARRGGTAVLVLEFELQTNRWDLPLPMSWIHAIRTAQPATDEEVTNDTEDQDFDDDEA